MGKKISRFISPSRFVKTAGTWTPSVASNVVKEARTAADAAFTLIIPFGLPEEGQTYQAGAKIESIDVWYSIATAACDDFATVEIEKVTLPATTVAVSATTHACTQDTAHDTAAERLAVDNHKMTVTPTADLYLAQGYAYYLVLVVDAAASTVFTIYGAQVNYDYESY